MLSFIEVGFYISLAVMLCLLFLLINHLKSRIITLENQNEGIMDVMKMIRGNLVNSDKEQKQVKDSLLSLAKNVSQVSSVVHTIQNTPLEKSNITLEVEDLSSVQGNITNESVAESEEDTEDETQEMAEENNDLEVVNIEWPTDGNIEIHKIVNDDLNDYDDPEINRRMMEMAQTHLSTPMFMNSSDASDLQKMFFMMSMGNGVPMSNIIFENTRDYERLPEMYDDPGVEQLPESPMSELIYMNEDEDEEDLPDLIDIDEEEKLEELEEPNLNTRIDDLIAEVTKEKEDISIAPVEEEVVVSVAPVEEEEVVVSVAPVEEEEEEKSVTLEKEIPMDFSKMDLRTLRSLVSTQGKVTHEKVSKMKKAELVRILSSSE
jgi:hypothetical protein